MDAPVFKRSCIIALSATLGVVLLSPAASGQVLADAAVPDAASPSCNVVAVSDAGFDVTPFQTPSGALPPDPGAAILDDGSLPAYCGGDIFQELGVTSPNVAGFDFSSVAAPYQTPADCANFDSQGHEAAHTCLCNNCFADQQQCDALAGCRAIQKCGQDTGCTDTNSCYYANPTCSAIIDGFGTGSVATALSQALLTCGQQNGCPKQ